MSLARSPSKFAASAMWRHWLGSSAGLQLAVLLVSLGRPVTPYLAWPLLIASLGLCWKAYKTLTHDREQAAHQEALVESQRRLISQTESEAAELRSGLLQKESLLRGIHHRVSNDLQIVSSLLELQAGYSSDPRVRSLFADSRARVRSMALIHDRLYGSRDLARVDFQVYVRGLAEDLYRSHRRHESEIAFEVSVNAAPLPVELAIPCGLVLNELISNCLKHGFADARRGAIQVALKRQEGLAVLTVSDNGRGFPPDLSFAEELESFGLQLVKTLADQLHGRLELRSNGSCHQTVLTFAAA